MQSGWRVGYVFGIPLYINSSWLVVLALLTLANGLEWQETYPDWGTALAWGAGFSMALLLFGSVLLHELGHSLVAQSQGIKVNSITLFIFGGIASIDRESKTPAQAFQVAIAGPAVSFFAILLFSLLTPALPAAGPMSVVTMDLARINLVLGLFNLIPGLPLDGGQIVKAAVWQLTGNRFVAVHWAAKAGTVLGWLAIVCGMTLVWRSFVLDTNEFGGFWIALLGWFAVRNATAYDRLTDIQEAITKIPCVDGMSREFRVINADMNLRDFADEYLLAELSSEKPYYAASEGRFRGLVMPDEMRFVERSFWEKQTVHSIVRPLKDLIKVEEQTPLVEAINLLEIHKLSRLTVVSTAGAVSGIIDRGDIVKVVAKMVNLPVLETEIKRVKLEGTYPVGLQLAGIAKVTDVVSR